MKSLSLAVSEFALPAPRTGSIETYSGFGGVPNVGTALHLEVQLQRVRERPGYVAERWISHVFTHAGHRITVGGRMDGFLFGRPSFIEELKSAYNLEELKAALARNPDHPYKLQLRTYGYLQYQATGAVPELNLHLINARTKRGEDVPLDLDIDGYEAWLARRLGELVDEQKMFNAAEKRRKLAAQALRFPFPEARPGQKELIATIEQKMTGKGRVLLQAPTGLGKTTGVLFPVLTDALARGQKTLYLTAKNSQHDAAEDAVKRLQEGGAKVRSVTVHAKGKMCLKDEPFCNPEYCEFARDHYSKLARFDVRGQLNRKKRLTAKAFKKIALAHEVCPFDLQFEAAPFADVIIGDYNYVFSPRNSRGRLTHSGWREQKSLPNVVIDEAHNLPARATEYFSAALNLADLEFLVSRVPDDLTLPAHAVLDGVRTLMSDVAGSPGGSPRQVAIEAAQLAPLLQRALELQTRYLESAHELQTNDPVLRLSNAVSEFVSLHAQIDDNFFTTYTPDGRGGSGGGGTLKLTCCDASAWLGECYGDFANVVAFSATVKPFAYYAELLGLDTAELITAEFDSPFPAAHRKLLVIPQISTKYRDRERNLVKIKETIERLINLKRGNYFVFFPSFEFMNRVLALVDAPEFRVVAQTRDMRREHVGEVLGQLREGIPTLVFAVQGGMFAEGVDYPGDMLIGALIVGPALPNFDFERELLRQHFDRKHGTGFDYAYTYPAMARVVQSAGRVIRSPSDRGLIVLMDRRFLDEGYRKSMPREWTDATDAVSTQILEDVRQFWRAGEP